MATLITNRVIDPSVPLTQDKLAPLSAANNLGVKNIGDWLRDTAVNTTIIQSTSGVVALTGNYINNNGDSRGTNITIGTNDNFNLNLETAGTTRITITSSGNVGFGTSTPTSDIDLRKASPTLNVEATATNLPAEVSLKTRTISNNLINTFVRSTSSGGVVGTSSSHPLSIVTNNVERAVITSSGDINVIGNINGNVLATGTLSARSLQNRFADIINVKDFGAVGNSTTNDTQALSAAFNYLLSQNGGTLYIPKGIYNIRDRINITCNAQQHIKVIGDGRYVSTLRFSGADNLGLNFVSTSLSNNQLPSFEVSNLGLIATRDSVGTALTFNYTNSNNIDATVNLSDIFIGQDVDNISESGSGYGYWGRGIFCNNARNGEIRNLHFYGEMNKAPNFTSSGITLSGESTAFVISDTLILESTTGIYATGTSEGVYIHNSDIVGVYYGVYHDIASGAEPQLTVTDSHINAQNVGVWTKNVQQSVVANSLIYANSWLTGSNWPAWTGVLFQGPNSRYNKVVGCTFAKENTRTGDTTTGIDFNEGGYYTATGNHFFGFNSNQLTYGVQARSGVTNCVVGDDNVFHFVTAPTSFHPNASSCFRQALLHTTNTGNVGIGTFNPNERLTVVGTISAGGGFNTEQISIGTPYRSIYQNNTSVESAYRVNPTGNDKVPLQVVRGTPTNPIGTYGNFDGTEAAATFIKYSNFNYSTPGWPAAFQNPALYALGVHYNSAQGSRTQGIFAEAIAKTGAPNGENFVEGARIHGVNRRGAQDASGQGSSPYGIIALAQLSGNASFAVGIESEVVVNRPDRPGGAPEPRAFTPTRFDATFLATNRLSAQTADVAYLVNPYNNSFFQAGFVIGNGSNASILALGQGGGPLSASGTAFACYQNAPMRYGLDISHTSYTQAAIAIPNTASIKARRASSSAEDDMLSYGADNRLYLGGGAQDGIVLNKVTGILSLQGTEGNQIQWLSGSNTATNHDWKISLNSAGSLYFVNRVNASNLFPLTIVKNPQRGIEIGEQLRFFSIPTSSAGLPSGSVWRDAAAGNVLKIVP